MVAPTFQTADLSSNRFSAMPHDTLQIVLFYDGNNSCTFAFEYKNASGVGVVTVEEIKPFGTEIKTVQYAMNGTTLTGRFWVKGVQANGVVDGLAFGLYLRDVKGNYHILRSNSAGVAPQACFVSAWPLGMNNSVFAPRVPQMSDPYARETALAVISGAKLLPDGQYTIDVL